MLNRPFEDTGTELLVALCNQVALISQAADTIHVYVFVYKHVAQQHAVHAMHTSSQSDLHMHAHRPPHRLPSTPRTARQVEFQREKLMSSHVLLPLIELLRSDHDVLLLAVAKALINLSSGNAAAKESIVNEGGVRSLLPHLLTKTEVPLGL